LFSGIKRCNQAHLVLLCPDTEPAIFPILLEQKDTKEQNLAASIIRATEMPLVLSPCAAES
jgi:hypothetical protein